MSVVAFKNGLVVNFFGATAEADNGKGLLFIGSNGTTPPIITGRILLSQVAGWWESNPSYVIVEPAGQVPLKLADREFNIGRAKE